MGLYARYLLEGGGSTRTIGTGAISIGNIGNVVNDTFAIDYPGTSDGKEVEAPSGTYPIPQGTLPMLDSGVINPPHRTNSAPPPANVNLPSLPATGGKVIAVLSGDQPSFGPWPVYHPTTGNVWATTSGSNSFCEYVVGTSSSFPANYVTLNSAPWTITVVGSNCGSIWTDPGRQSSVSGDGTTLGTSSGCASAPVVSGPSFATSHKYIPIVP